MNRLALGAVATWPTAITTGKPQASSVNAAILGTTVNAGRTQLTFDGHPLYFYAGGAASGQVNGQGLQHLWHTVSPTGVADTSSSPGPMSSGGSGSGHGY